VDNSTDLRNMLAWPGIKRWWKHQIKYFFSLAPPWIREQCIFPGVSYETDLNNLPELARRGFRNPWRPRLYMYNPQNEACEIRKVYMRKLSNDF